MSHLFNSLKKAVKDLKDEVSGTQHPHPSSAFPGQPQYQHGYPGPQQQYPGQQVPFQQQQYQYPPQQYPQQQPPPQQYWPQQQYPPQFGGQQYPQQQYQQADQPQFGPQSPHKPQGPPPGSPQQGPPQQAAVNSPPPVPRHPPTGPVIPKVKGEPRLLGLASDPRLNRDSGGSVRFGNRVLWVYRDTQYCNPDGSVRELPIICNTASWSNYNADGTPAVQVLHPNADLHRSTTLWQYGPLPSEESFLSLRHYDCHAAGNRDDGTRICIWPDIPPVVTNTDPSTGRITAYVWAKRSHITSNLGVVVANPATALYRLDYDPARHHGDALPDVTLVDKAFWPENAIPYGHYGAVVAKDGTLYLWAQTGEGLDRTTALARVPVHLVENKAAYQFWIGESSGGWTKHPPAIGQDGIAIKNSNIGGQGNYYWSEPWQSYVWIGGGPFPVADFFVSTAPRPEGPWIEPVKIFSAPNGTHDLGAYSLQAHPDLNTNPNENAIYVTYTKNDKNGNIANYTTPLYKVEWE